MFERYTDHARRVIFFARHAAIQSGSSTIETEHLLLGLIREVGPGIPRLVPSVSIDDLRMKIPRKDVAADNAPLPITMPLSSECRRILSYSAEEANNLNHRHIAAEHLLLAILREESCVAARLLREAGIQLESLRERVASDLGHESSPAVAKPGGRSMVHALIDELPENMLGHVKEAIDRTMLSVRAGKFRKRDENTPSTTAPPEGDEVFRQLEREMFKAHEGAPDLATLDRLYADDFLSTNADGRVVDKQGWFEILRSGRFPVDKITTDDFKVRRNSDSAVVTGRSSYFAGGKKVWDVRHTEVWVLRNGRWQLVSWQGTPAPA